nr:unnamed protein product [Callosobruchus analis]
MPPKQRKKWDAESMRRAVEAVENREMGTLKASKSFNKTEDICALPTYTKTRPNQSPQPSCSGTIHKSGAKRGSTAILTSTPYKSELENSLKKRKKTKENKKRDMKNANKKKLNSKGVNKRKRKVSSSSSSESDVEQIELLDTKDDMSSGDVDTEYFYSNNLLSEDPAGSKWIRYVKCQRWCHETCASVEKVICDLCLDL